MLQTNNREKEGCHGYGSADFKELKSNIDHAVKEMPEQMRNVFVLAKYSGFTYLEIAHQLGISVKTVETQMSRALVRLRIQLTRYLSTVIFLGFLLQ
jgi:RNA polymerase sigma-70 factor (ECF subfamily)